MNNLDNDYHQWGPVLNVSQDCVRVPSLAVPVWQRGNLFVVNSCNVICGKPPRLNISHSLWKICKGENAQWFLFHSTLVKWTLLLSEKSDKICWAWVKKNTYWSSARPTFILPRKPSSKVLQRPSCQIATVAADGRTLSEKWKSKCRVLLYWFIVHSCLMLIIADM